MRAPFRAGKIAETGRARGDCLATRQADVGNPALRRAAEAPTTRAWRTRCRTHATSLANLQDRVGEPTRRVRRTYMASSANPRDEFGEPTRRVGRIGIAMELPDDVLLQQRDVVEHWALCSRWIALSIGSCARHGCCGVDRGRCVARRSAMAERRAASGRAAAGGRAAGGSGF